MGENIIVQFFSPLHSPSSLLGDPLVPQRLPDALPQIAALDLSRMYPSVAPRGEHVSAAETASSSTSAAETAPAAATALVPELETQMFPPVLPRNTNDPVQDAPAVVGDALGCPPRCSAAAAAAAAAPAHLDPARRPGRQRGDLERVEPAEGPSVVAPAQAQVLDAAGGGFCLCLSRKKEREGVSC